MSSDYATEARRQAAHDAALDAALAEEGISDADLPNIAPANRPSYRLTDVGNAERLRDQHGHRLRYCRTGTSGRWHAWDGKAWSPDDRGAAMQAAVKTAKSIYVEAAGSESSESIAKHAMRTENAARLEAMLKVASSDPKIVASRSDFDTDPWSLNTQSGIVDLRSGKLRPSDPAEMHSQITTARYERDAEAPRWESFIREILPDEATRTYVQKLVGYSATGDIGENVLPFAYGSGANGKSVFLSAIRETLGTYAAEAPPRLLERRRERGIPVDIAHLEGYRFVTTAEVEGVPMDTELMKKITGEPVLVARRMRQDFTEFVNVTSLWLAANDRPKVDGLDDAVWRRYKVLPFTVTIPPEQRDPNLARVLREERDGILRWIVEGAVLYQDQGLVPPKAVADAIEDYRADSNPLADWFDAECELDAECEVGAAELRASYDEWARHYKIRNKIGATSGKWSAGLEALGLRVEKGRAGRKWHGVKLRKSAPGSTLDF